MSASPAPSEIFDRRLRRVRRDRAAEDFDTHAFLHRRMADELIDRLGLVSRDFRIALDLGCGDGEIARQLRGRGMTCIAADAGFRFAAQSDGVQCDEDRLPFADATFDLVMSVGVLDSVNDLPGALALVRRILKPDGLFLAAFVGAGSLPRLRAAMAAADGDRAAPRIHPQIDVRAAGDLLMRAGFALPVADGDRVTVRYGSLIALAADLRGAAGGNLLHDRGSPLNRTQIMTALEDFARNAAEDGKVEETVELVYLSGWSPSPEQSKPARRGSGTVSLADALKRKTG